MNYSNPIIMIFDRRSHLAGSSKRKGPPPTDSGIYCITNLGNGRQYIGRAKSVSKRIAAHFHGLRNNSHPNKILLADSKIFGIAAFRFESILYCSKSELTRKERFYVDTLRPEYNAAINNPYYKLPIRKRPQFIHYMPA